MSCQLHHVAVNTCNFEETVRFFKELFAMEVTQEKGQAPNRKLWFREGIQVNENPGERSDGDRYDHIGIQVDNWEQLRRRAEEMGCTPVQGKPHWFVTPDKIVIELMR